MTIQEVGKGVGISSFSVNFIMIMKKRWYFALDLNFLAKNLYPCGSAAFLLSDAWGKAISFDKRQTATLSLCLGSKSVPTGTLFVEKARKNPAMG